VQHRSDLRRRRAKRTRPKAARLALEQVDEGTTERLFDGETDEEVVYGRHFANRGDDPGALLAANEDVLLNLTGARVPVIRYEWHNQAGETLIVEAAWPFDSTPPVELRGPDIRRSGGYDSWRPREAPGHRTSEAHARRGAHQA
jgi:hypothetical protein